MSKKLFLSLVLIMSFVPKHIFAYSLDTPNVSKLVNETEKKNELSNTDVVTELKTNGVDYGTYKWTTAIPMPKCDVNGKKLSPAPKQEIIESVVGQRFVIYNTLPESGYIIIKIVPYEDEYHFFGYNYNGSIEEYFQVYQSPKKYSGNWLRGKKNEKKKEDKKILEENKSKNVDHGSYGDRQIYFKVKASDILKYAVKANIVRAGMTFGVLNFPLKFRPQAGKQDFSSAFNLNAAIGVSLLRRAESEWQQSFVGGFGMSFLSLDTSVIQKADNKGKLEAGNSYPAVSFSIGYILQYQKVQLGVFVGVDRLTNLYQQQFDWKYQGNAWFSIGMGYSIFAPQKSESASSTQQGAKD